MTGNFRWGIIGPGRIARQFAEDIRVVEGAELYAVASRSGAEKFIREFNIPAKYDSYQALVEDPKIDAVYIATPHNFHFENARLCLEAGKPVLCEKPLTVNARQAETLIRLAKEKQVFLMEALWTRCLPLYQTLKSLLDQQAIGQLVALHSTFCFALRGDDKERWLNPHLAGGTLLDLGVYPIAISQWLLQSNPLDFQALAILGSTGVDTLLSVNLQYPSGAISQFTTSFLYQANNELTIHGTQGSMTVRAPFWAATEGYLERNGARTALQAPLRSHGFEYEIEEAMRCIRQGRLESRAMTHADTLANLQLMDNIRKQIGVRYPFE